MSPEYAIALFGVFASLCAILAFAWALRHRQLHTEDLEMYEAVADDEPDYSASPAQLPRRVGWLFALILLAVFSLISWLIVRTITVAGHPAHQPPAAQSSPPAA